MRAPTAFNLSDQRDRGWYERAQTCIDLLADILPERARLADIGCGDRKLRDLLAANGIWCEYAGFDLLPQSTEVIRFDVRSDRLPGGFDIAVLMGVTEYLEDIPTALQLMGESCQWLAASHVLASHRSPSPARLSELGWVSHLDRAEFTRAVGKGGFEVVRERMTPDGRTLLVVARRVAT